MTLAIGPRPAEPAAVGAICPYLKAADGRSRRARAWRGHRCAAVEPPTPLSGDKQRRLCLLAAHVDCLTYRAAAGGPDHVGRWAIPRMTPTIVEAAPVASEVLERLGGGAVQLGLAGVLAGAVVAVAAGGLDGGQGLAGTSPALSASPTLRPTPAPGPTPTPPAATPTAGPTATPVPTQTPAPPTPRSYTVRSGDTLWAISIRFGTTVAAIQELNGLGSSTRLRVGQVLLLP